ncbi:Curli biogenesis system outer membrane secretion channel CsgG [Duganella sp. OV458]|nr:Curli biogenesis system outer membrane secretion channel CsgG [Duganella sp. OV458]SDJ80030.1 Curli biogenesis system outer membrane secretion channel CsgG [Duganella sp. OV510]
MRFNNCAAVHNYESFHTDNEEPMKSYLSLAALLIVPVVGFAEPSEVSERSIDVPKCTTPAAKVVFTEFKCKSADCSSGSGQQDPRQYRWWERQGNVAQPTYTGVGTGMTEMLGTALTQTGCFDVQERAALDEINKELALVGKKVEAEAADYMITGSITSLGFEQSSTGLGGMSFLKGPLGLLAGSVDFKKSKVHMNMDIRVVDVKRAKIIASKTFQANNEKNGFGISALGWGGGTGLGGSHASISGSPLEEVARDLLVKSTSFLTETIAAKNITERIAVKATDVSPK